MPGSPYLEQRPPGLLTWPLLLRILLVVFAVECIVGAVVWMQWPAFRWLVYLILGLDLSVLLVLFILTSRGSDGDD